MLFILLLSAIILNKFCANASSCATFNVDKYYHNGFNIVTYEIPFNSNKDQIANVLYNNSLSFNSVDQPIYYYIYDLSINVTVTDTTKPFMAHVYPGKISYWMYASNFAIGYQGFFVPPETGDYTFTIDEASGGAAIYVYDNLDMYCCEDMDSYAWLPKTSQVTYIPSDPNYQSQSVTVNLKAGHGYLLQYGYTNFEGDAIFKTSVTFPSGKTTTDFTDYIYNSFASFHCDTLNSTSSVITLGTEAYTTTYSTTEITNIYTGTILDAPYTSIDTIYYIMTPVVVSSSSIISSSSAIISSSSISSVISSSSEASSSSSESSVISSSFSKPSATSSMISSTFTSSISSTLSSSSSSSHEKLSLASDSSSTAVSYDGKSSKISKSSTIGTIFSSDVVVSTRAGMPTESSNTSFASVSTNIKSFSNSSSTGYIATTSDTSLTVPYSSNESYSKDSTDSHSTLGQSESSKMEISRSISHSNEGSVSTSTYTDEYGVTKTIIVKCSSKPKNIDVHTTTSNDADITAVVDDNNHIGISTITKTYNTATRDAEKSISSKSNASASENNASKNTEVTATVKVQISDSSSSSALMYVQQSPNIAGRNVVSAFFSVVLLLSQLFLL